MSNRDVAKKWRAQIKDNGHSLNMFFEHDVIYSYGYHFPMAVITGKKHNGQDIIVQNSYRYSNTTARHLSHMRGECYGDAVITIGTPLLKQLINNNNDLRPEVRKAMIDEIQARIELQTGKRDRARKEHMKEFWQRDIDENLSQLEILKSL